MRKSLPDRDNATDEQVAELHTHNHSEEVARIPSMNTTVNKCLPLTISDIGINQLLITKVKSSCCQILCVVGF